MSLFSGSRALCPPLAANAAVVLDGSSVAGQGVGTLSAFSTSSSVEFAEFEAASSPLFEVPFGQVDGSQCGQQDGHQQKDQSSAFQHGPQQGIDGKHDGSSVFHRSPLLPWDIQLKLPRVGWCYQQTVFAVSERAALYQWKKGHAAPLGARVRAVPGLQLF